jgi:hypothetical protein
MRDGQDRNLDVANMLFVSGMYLVETVQEPGSWWMGQERKNGTIECWGKYGPLQDAILGL